MPPMNPPGPTAVGRQVSYCYPFGLYQESSASVLRQLCPDISETLLTSLLVARSGGHLDYDIDQ